jgi:hypothetical protein
MNDYDRPTDKDIYIAENGWHFNKKACDYAVQYLKGKDGKRIKPLSKEEVDAMLAKYGLKLEKNRGWDYVYAANMAKSDMEGSPLSDEKSQAMYVKILIDDPDAADGQVFNRFFADCVNAGIPIDWAEMI